MGKVGRPKVGSDEVVFRSGEQGLLPVPIGWEAVLMAAIPQGRRCAMCKKRRFAFISRY